MKLLTPLQNKDLKEQQNLRDILRIQELEKAANKARLELAKAQADFNDTLAKNQKQWLLDEQEHEQRKIEMKREIDSLDALRLNALIPVNLLGKSTEERLDEAVKFMANLRQREEYAEDLTERLQDKLDEVGQKEQDLLVKERDLNLREDGVKRQQENIALGSAELNRQILEFKTSKSQEEKTLHQKESALALQEDALMEREAIVENRTKELQDRAVRLADERGTLDRAWKELEKRKAAISP